MTIEKFKIAQEDSLEMIGFNGQGEIKYNVVGWRSGEYVQVKVRWERDWNEDKHTWKITLNTPSYGRDSDACDEITAYENIAACLPVAVEAARHIQANTAILDKHKAKGDAHREEERRKEEAKRKALYDADKPVGMKLAKHIMDQMVKEARSKKGDSQTITFFTRGKRQECKVRCEYTWTQLTLFNVGYARRSRKDVLAMLADAHIDTLSTGSISTRVVDPKIAKFLLSKS